MRPAPGWATALLQPCVEVADRLLSQVFAVISGWLYSIVGSVCSGIDIPCRIFACSVALL